MTVAKITVAKRKSLATHIDVDGVSRPIHNSAGRRIHATDDGIINFWRWFDGSEAVDDQGRPLVVYHGTMRDIKDGVFKDAWAGCNFIFFTDDPVDAGRYARGFGRSYNEGSHIVPVYLALKKPKKLDYAEQDDDREIRGDADLAQDEGFDGMIVENASSGKSYSTQYVAFRAEQIKSVIGNKGAFSNKCPHLLDHKVRKPKSRLKRRHAP